MRRAGRWLVWVAAALIWSAAGSGALAQPAQQQDRVARAQVLFQEGIAAYEAGRLDEALRKLRDAHRLTRSPELAFNVARVYERMGDAAGAQRYFRMYLQQGHPTDAERADIERRIQVLQELARRQRDQVFAAPPSNDELTAEARTFFLRGVSMFRRRQYQAALDAFMAAHNFAPQLHEVVFNLAVTNERLNRLQDAIDWYAEYLRLRRDAPDRAQVTAKRDELRARLHH
jgi:tetratricopeptide (TPR) repeat protein